MAQKPYKTKAIQPMNPEIMDVSPELDELQEFMPISAEDRERLKKDIQAAYAASWADATAGRSPVNWAGAWCRLRCTT